MTGPFLVVLKWIITIKLYANYDCKFCSTDVHLTLLN